MEFKDHKNDETSENKDLQNEKQSLTAVGDKAEDSKPSIDSGHSRPPRWDEDEEQNLSLDFGGRPLRLAAPKDEDASSDEAESGSASGSWVAKSEPEIEEDDFSETGEKSQFDDENSAFDNSKELEIGDVSPADCTDQPPNNGSSKAISRPLLIGSGVLLVIIALTVFAFREKQETKPVSSQSSLTESLAPSAENGTLNGEGENGALGLPAKAPDAVSFSPTPETEATASAPIPPKKQAKAPAKTPAKAVEPKSVAKAEVKNEVKTGEAALVAGAKATETKAAAATAATETKAAATTAAAETKAAETTAATETKAAETTAAAETKAAATTAAAETKAAETTAATETKAAETTAATETKADAATAATETKAAAATAATETKAAATTAATETKAAATTAAAETKAAETTAATVTKAAATSATVQAAPTEVAKEAVISDLWVVNISSTSDPAESLRLLNKINTADVGGQVYFYETTLDGKALHRIRIGFFNSQEEAAEVGRKVKEQFSLTAIPWAVRPTQDEVDLHRRK